MQRCAVLVLAGACSFHPGGTGVQPGPDGRRADAPIVVLPDAYPDDLVAYYQMDEVAAILDATGHGHDGTCTACPTEVFGVVNGAYDFADQRFDVATAPELRTESGTVATWLEFDTLPTTTYACPVNSYLPTDADTWQICYAGQFGTWEVYMATTPFNFGASATVAADEWHHLALTWTPTLAVLYVDGIEAASQAIDSPLTFDSTSPFTFGSDRSADGTNDAAMLGKLDELRLYNDALDAGRIAALAGL